MTGCVISYKDITFMQSKDGLVSDEALMAKNKGPSKMEIIQADLPVPLYHQVNLVLKERIKSGAYAFEETIPSEAELAQEFGVSRITVGRALQELVNEGLVKRRRGAGTTVTFRHSEQTAANIAHFRNTLAEIASTTTVRVLEFGYVAADEQVATALTVPVGTTVQRAVRVRSYRDTPFSHLVTYLPESIGLTFTEAELAASSLHALLKRAGHEPAEATQHFTAIKADVQRASVLDILVGEPLLKVERIVRNARKETIEYLHASYVGERYSHTMRISEDIRDT